MNVIVCILQTHAPADLYLMTKSPEDAPNSPDVLEIEFKKGVCPSVYISSSHVVGLFSPLVQLGFMIQSPVLTCVSLFVLSTNGLAIPTAPGLL